MNQPIKLTLYDPQTDEVKAEHTRMFVPWKILKASVRLTKEMNKEQPTEEDLDQMAALIVEVFGNKFSVDELNEGADVGEMMAVLKAVISHASGGISAGAPFPKG
jgi:hypothetical protein